MANVVGWCMGPDYLPWSGLHWQHCMAEVGRMTGCVESVVRCELRTWGRR